MLLALAATTMRSAGSVILRHMRDAGGFVRAAPDLAAPLEVALGDGEVVVGWFRNPPPFAEHVIVFTDAAMLAGTPASHRRIGYAEIRSIAYPRKTPNDWQLALETTGGLAALVIGGATRPGSNALNAYCLAAALRCLID